MSVVDDDSAYDDRMYATFRLQPPPLACAEASGARPPIRLVFVPT